MCVSYAPRIKHQDGITVAGSPSNCYVNVRPFPLVNAYVEKTVYDDCKRVVVSLSLFVSSRHCVKRVTVSVNGRISLVGERLRTNVQENRSVKDVLDYTLAFRIR